MNKLLDHNILVTGAARRIGREIALAIAKEGANVVIHYGHSAEAANALQAEIADLNRQSFLLQADLEDPNQASELIPRANEFGILSGLINNAAIFEPLTLENTDLQAWNRHLAINLTAPFLISQAFARQIPPDRPGRIVNLLDWRALRPSGDHFPYDISKAGVAALTQALAVALAPRISVNGLALGAILPPVGGNKSPDIIARVPAKRWANLGELDQAIIFLLTGPEYITGEIIHLDGGRHLT